MSLVQSAPESKRALNSTPFVLAVAPWAFILVIFVAWEGLVRLFGIPQFVLPAPSAVIVAGWEWRALIFENAAQTLMTTMIGFGAAVIFGVLVGVALGSSILVYNGVYPALIGFNAIRKWPSYPFS